MITFLLALGLTQAPEPAPAPQSAQARLQSCETTPEGWVCNYRMPDVILQGVTPGTVVLTDRPGVIRTVPVTLPPAPPPEISSAEADRQARLIARCADASWLSLCLPGDRREARILRDAANARAALRAEVTLLLSEDRCDDARRAALAGGDLTLAWEVRTFCAPDPASGLPPSAETAAAATVPD